MKEFRNPKISVENGEPHFTVQIWRDGVFVGYINVHTHRVLDDSISVGTTVRFPTKVKPR